MVGVLLLFGALLLVLVRYARFWLREDSPTFLKDKEKEGKGTFCGPRLYLQNTGAEVRSRGGCNMYGSSELDAPALSCDCCCYLFPFHIHLLTCLNRSDSAMDGERQALLQRRLMARMFRLLYFLPFSYMIRKENAKANQGTMYPHLISQRNQCNQPTKRKSKHYNKASLLSSSLMLYLGFARRGLQDKMQATDFAAAMSPCLGPLSF